MLINVDTQGSASGAKIYTFKSGEYKNRQFMVDGDRSAEVTGWAGNLIKKGVPEFEVTQNADRFYNQMIQPGFDVTKVLKKLAAD